METSAHAAALKTNAGWTLQYMDMQPAENAAS